MSQNEPEIYSLEQAGQALGVSVADIESYVAEGLVEPRRDAAGAALFTRAEMRRLWSIVTLHRDLDLNLPGVAAVLRLREQFEQVRRDLNTLAEIMERELGADCWDRLWPQDRPRPSATASVEEGGPPDEPRKAPPPDDPPTRERDPGDPP
jgi:DNA-binding transcriptional MerR regulator